MIWPLSGRGTAMGCLQAIDSRGFGPNGICGSRRSLNAFVSGVPEKIGASCRVPSASCRVPSASCRVQSAGDDMSTTVRDAEDWSRSDRLGTPVGRAVQSTSGHGASSARSPGIDRGPRGSTGGRLRLVRGSGRASIGCRSGLGRGLAASGRRDRDWVQHWLGSAMRIDTVSRTVHPGSASGPQRPRGPT